MNDRFRFLVNPDRVEIQIPTGTPQLVIRQGYVTLPQDPSNPATVETGSVWNDNAVSGLNKQKDAAGVKDL